MTGIHDGIGMGVGDGSMIISLGRSEMVVALFSRRTNG